MIVSQILSSNAGELSPRLSFRTDFAKYGSGCRKLENFISTVTGASVKRPGTDVITDVDVPTGGVGRLIPVQIDTSNHCVLVLSDNYCKVIANGAVALNVDDSPVTFATPWGYGDLAQLKFKQINDIIYFAHPNYPVHRLKRFADNDWLLEEMDFRSGAPILPINADETKIINLDYRNSTTSSAWADDVLYTIGSRVFSGGKTWVCQQSHTSALPGQPESPLWEEPPTGTGSFVVYVDGGVKDYLVQRPLWLELILASPVTEGEEVTLTTTHEIFQPGHVGSVWRFDRRREADKYEILQEFTASVGVYSAPIEVQGKWNFDTNGTWYGNVTIEISEDNGSSWKQLKYYTSTATAPRNVSVTGETAVRSLMRLYWAGYTGVAATAPYGILSASDADIKGWVVITAVESTGLAYGEALSHIQTMITHRWGEGAWSDYQGYPRAVELHQARIVYAGTARRPHTVWGSAEDDYNNFSGGTEPNDSYAHTLVIGERDPISWLISDKFLMLGNGSAEYIMYGANENGPIVPQSGTARRQSTLGCDSRGICAIPSETVPLFVQRGGDRIHELNYSFDNDRFVASNLCVLADHIHRNKVISDMALQRVPFQVLWVVDTSGYLTGYTYERRQEVMGWHRHTSIGAAFAAVCTCRGADSEDHVYFMVNRAGTMLVERFGRGCLVAPAISQTWTDGTLSIQTGVQDFSTVAMYSGYYVAACWNGYTWYGDWGGGAVSGDWQIKTAVVLDIPELWGGKYYPGGFLNGYQRWVRVGTEAEGELSDFIIFLDAKWQVFSGGEPVAVSTTTDIYGNWTAPSGGAVIGTSTYPHYFGVDIAPSVLGDDLVHTPSGAIYYSTAQTLNVALDPVPSYYNPITQYTLYWGTYLGARRWMVKFGAMDIFRATTADTDPTACSFVNNTTGVAVTFAVTWAWGGAGDTMKVGLPFTSIYEPMPMFLQLGNGTSRSRESKIHRISFDLEDSYGGKFGPNLDTLLPIYEDSSMHTGESEKGFQGSYDLTGDLFVVSDIPAPFTIRGVTVKYNVNGDI